MLVGVLMIILMVFIIYYQSQQEAREEAASAEAAIGDVQSPAEQQANLIIPAPPALTASAEDLSRGGEVYHEVCASCHGDLVRGGAIAADLRLMTATTHTNFQAIVRDGLYQAHGMEKFSDTVTAKDAEQVHQYIVSRAGIDREAQKL